jgi:predicted XRE-type DNA-binding protein
MKPGKKRFENVWDAIEDSARDSASMRARADLMIMLQEHLRKRGVSQAQAAKLLQVTQPRISDLMRGKIDLFSSDTLIEMLGRLGARVKVSVEFQRAA